MTKTGNGLENRSKNGSCFEPDLFLKFELNPDLFAAWLEVSS